MFYSGEIVIITFPDENFGREARVVRKFNESFVVKLPSGVEKTYGEKFLKERYPMNNELTEWLGGK